MIEEANKYAEKTEHSSEKARVILLKTEKDSEEAIGQSVTNTFFLAESLWDEYHFFLIQMNIQICLRKNQ